MDLWKTSFCESFLKLDWMYPSSTVHAFLPLSANKIMPSQPKLMRSLQMYRGKCQWKSMIEYKYIFWEVHSSGKCIYSVCAAILRLLKLWFELPFRFKCCWPPSIIQIKPDYFGIEESISDLIIMMKFKLIHAYVTHLFEDKFLTNDQLLTLHMLLFSQYWQSLEFE